MESTQKKPKSGTRLGINYGKEMSAAQKNMAKKYAAKPAMLQAIKEGKAPKTLKKIMGAK